MKTFLFEAFDTLFFREARPMESIGSRPPTGRFPPQARTLAGAVRGYVGEALGVDWPAYRKGNDPSQQSIEAVIGKAKAPGIGRLQLTGPYPTLKGERLYPLPLSWLAKRDAESEGYDWERLTLGKDPKPIQCDLGKVYLPQTSGDLPGAKPLENAWLDRADLQRVLLGEKPLKPHSASALFAAEGRLGIGIDSARRSVVEGLLYQTVHARPLQEVAVGVEVDGLTPDLDLRDSLIRLGGEGRFAGVAVSATTPRHDWALQPPAAWRGVLLVLLTPANFGEPFSHGEREEPAARWLPPGFKEDTDAQGAKVWRGAIAGVKLTLLSAVIGKAVREGGWDLANHCSRPAHGLIPAGSVFFCTVESDARQAATDLQGQKIGHETELGRGELAAGFWEGVQE